jgi:hypothetical protein
MISRRSQFSGRALATLVACGALVGFTFPALAASIVRQLSQGAGPHLVKPPRVPRSVESLTPPGEPALQQPSPPARLRYPPKALAGRQGRRHIVAPAKSILTKLPPPSTPSGGGGTTGGKVTGGVAAPARREASVVLLPGVARVDTALRGYILERVRLVAAPTTSRGVRSVLHYSGGLR